MISVGVFEDDDFSLSRALLRFSNCSLITNPKKANLDIALISCNLCRRPDSVETALAIVPDCLDDDLLASFSGRRLISYGLCRKNTVTASSLIDLRLAVSLQRKIHDVHGDIIEEQEIITSLDRGERTEDALGLVSTLLTLGVSPEDISKLSLPF